MNTEKKQIIEKLRRRIKDLEIKCDSYRKKCELRLYKLRKYHEFIDKLKSEGRVTIEELQIHFKSEKEVEGVVR